MSGRVTVNNDCSLVILGKRVPHRSNSIITEIYGEFWYPSGSWGWTSSSEKGKKPTKKEGPVGTPPVMRIICRSSSVPIPETAIDRSPQHREACRRKDAMKFRLIYPRWKKLDRQTEFHLPPHGPVVFAATLPPEWEVEFIDENVEPLPADDAVDFVGISMMLTSQVKRGWEIADRLPQPGHQGDLRRDRDDAPCRRDDDSTPMPSSSARPKGGWSRSSTTGRTAA